MEARVMLMSKRQSAADKRAYLKAVLERAIEQAEQYIDDRAVNIKAECAENQPVENIRMTLVRGQCPCRCALRLLQGD